MSIDEERELRRRLDGAFSTLTAESAPVDSTMRQGTRIRTRRRTAAVAGMAAAAAVAVAVPFALQSRTPAPSQTRHRHYSVTVHPASRQAAGDGLIAWGTVGGRRWEVRLTGAGGTGRGDKCVAALGSTSCGTPQLPAGSGPAVLGNGVGSAWSVAGYGQVMAQWGRVAADVAYLRVSLAGGTVLTLHPVRVYGIRAVAFAAPAGMIERVTAYSRRGVLATAVPFQGPARDAIINVWLRPGQQGLPRVTGTIAQGTYRGKPWSMVVYQGPWGRCLRGTGPAANGGTCLDGLSSPDTALSFWAGGSPQVFSGTAAPSVTQVVAALSNGGSIRVRPVAVAGQKYFAFVLRKGLRELRWTAYDRAGHVVASGGRIGQ
jgi:hypothetical protein